MRQPSSISPATRERRLHGRFFSLSVFEIAPQDPLQWTCAVSKSIAAKAVERNLIKRRCREAVRAHIKGFSIPLKLVFRAKKSVAQAVFAEVDSDIGALIEKMPAAGYNSLQ